MFSFLDLRAQVTTTLKEVQATLRTFISDRTIIVGHSADTDLKVRKETEVCFEQG